METAETDAERMTLFLAGDKRANGIFLAGVLSTGIYCLPSCPARKPLPRNVVFVKTPAEARALGLRACRRCRPDAFYAGENIDSECLETLAAHVRRDPGAFSGVLDMAAAAPWGATKLAQLFRCHFGMTPARFLAEARVQAAAALLYDPHKPVLEAGFEAGFDSASAYYRSFRLLKGCAPGAYRKSVTRQGSPLCSL